MGKRVFILFALLLCILNVQAIKVVFRLDDPKLRYDSVDFRIIQLFVEKDVPLCVGMIPCDMKEVPYEPDDTAYLALLNSPSIEVCLHGYTHIQTGVRGEFCSLSREEIERRISEGKRALKRYISKDIITFIPPWNAYNKDLPYVLRNNGFRIISGELFDECLAWMPKDVDMNYMPETLGHLMVQEGIWNAARNSIFENKEKDVVCIVMLHKCDLPDENSWKILEDLLDDCKKSDNIELYTFSALYHSGEQMNMIRYNANLLSGGLAKIVLSKGVMYPTWVCYMVHVLNAVLYALIAMIGFIVLLAKTDKGKRKRVFAAMCVAGLIILCATWWHWMSPLKLLILSIALCAIPLFIATMIKKNHN